MEKITSASVAKSGDDSTVRPAQSASTEWLCRSLDENKPYEIDSFTLLVDGNTKLKVDFTEKKCSTEYALSEKYKPTSETMKKYAKFNYVPSADTCDLGEGPVTPIYVEKIIFEGGKKLSNGKSVAIFKTPGWGFSWAAYSCVKQEKKNPL